MGKVCHWSGDDSEVCMCHRCDKDGEKKKHVVEGFANMKPLDVVGVDTHSHVGKMSIVYNPRYSTVEQLDEKLDYSLIPLDGLEELALAYTIGAKKHKHRPDVDPTTDDEEFAAIMRHLVAYRRGEERDQEGHHHLAAVSARCFKLIARRRYGSTTEPITIRNNPSKD